MTKISLSRLRDVYLSIRERGLSILTVEVTGISAQLLYLLLLPKQEIVTILALLAFTGLISGAVASTNTAKVYSGIAARSSDQNVPLMTLWLFLFEQGLGFVAALVLISRSLDTLNLVPMWCLLAISVVSNSAAITAFVRNTDTDFLRYNYLRAGANIVRVGCVFWATAVGRPELIGPIFLCTLIVPFIFGINVLISRLCVMRSRTEVRVLQLLYEYLLGLPAGAVRSFINNGLMLAAVEILSENEARFLRLLLLPKDIAGRVFNTMLPLFFDKMFSYRPTMLMSLSVLVGSLICGLANYVLAALIVNMGYDALPQYLLLFAASLQVYLVLPYIWRVVHGNRTIISTGTVLFSGAITYAAYRFIMPSDVGGFLGVMAIFQLLWLAAIVILSYRERSRDII